MTENNGSPDIFTRFGRWLHAKLILLELIAVVVLVLMMYINVKSGSEVGWIIIFPLAIMMFVYYFIRYGFEDHTGLPFFIFLFTNYSAEVTLFALFTKYMSMRMADMFLQGSAMLLGFSLLGIIVMKYREPGNILFKTEMMVRTALLTAIVIFLMLTPNEQLAGLGFAL